MDRSSLVVRRLRTSALPETMTTSWPGTFAAAAGCRTSTDKEDPMNHPRVFAVTSADTVPTPSRLRLAPPVIGATPTILPASDLFGWNVHMANRRMPAGTTSSCVSWHLCQHQTAAVTADRVPSVDDAATAKPLRARQARPTFDPILPASQISDHEPPLTVRTADAPDITEQSHWSVPMGNTPTNGTPLNGQ
tara:strand:- start:11226 stop:11801 length:576 start_codon:yes stop_codon:yes gene_type:complete